MELFKSGYGFLAAVFVLGTAVFVHELGHFLSAKLSRMRVEEFAFGFGPALLSLRRRDTAYSIRAVPFGGFVRIAGMEPGEESLSVERGFYARPRYQQLSVLFAGPAMNIALGAAVFIVIFSVWGLVIGEISPPLIDRVIADSAAAQSGIRPGDQVEAVDGQAEGMRVASVRPGSPAAQAGLRAGDRIWETGETNLSVPSDLAKAVAKAPGPSVTLQVQHQRVHPKTGARGYESKVLAPQLPVPPQRDPDGRAPDLEALWGLRFQPLAPTDLAIYIQQRPGEPLRFAVRRQSGARDELTVVPETVSMREAYQTEDGKETIRWVKAGRIGVVFQGQRRHPGLAEAAWIGVTDSVGFLRTIVVGFWAMATGKTAVQVAGPLGMMAMAAESAKLGLEAVLEFLGLISINLAIVNLLPLPITDGGRALIVAYEGLVRRRVGRKQEIWLVAGGVAVVVVLAISITLQDIINLARHGSP